MKHLFETPTNSFLQGDGHWAESSPDYLWGEDDEIQVNGMNHSPECPCRRKAGEVKGELR